MNTLDIILLAAIGLGTLLGLKSGLVKQLSFGAGIVIGLLQATIFYPKVADWLCKQTDWDKLICTILGFIAIFVATTILINLAGFILRWLLKAILLGWLDRTLGAAFSAVIAISIVVLGVNVSEGLIPDNSITSKTSQEQSLLYKEVAKVTFLIIDEAKKFDFEKD